MDDELKRIEEEIRKAKEKRQALEDRRNRRMKQIRARQERDRTSWLKKMSAVLDKTLSEMKGRTYFYEVTQEQIVEALRNGEIPGDVPTEEADQKTGNAEAKASSEDPDVRDEEEEESR